MPKYLIERNLPGAHEMPADELAKVAAASNDVLAQLHDDVQWVQSYVNEDRITCVYNARDKDVIREHARRGGFPCDDIREVSAIIDPVTGGA